MPNVVLRTENLTKRYGSLTAVNNLTLEVYEGEIFGFLGPNGAGKTTSINMMCGLLEPDAGRVWIHDTPLDGDDKGARSRIGVCPQNVVLWERLTCLEQLQFVGQLYGGRAGEARRRANHLLEILGLTEKRNAMARTLSGGMQRRLNLALALIHDPEIVVLDEPEAGLDPQSSVGLREYIRSLTREAQGVRPKTVILTTHNMDEADRLADRVAIIDYGELLILDTPETLKQRVGEGDIIEIRLSDSPADMATVIAALAAIAAEVRWETAEHTLQVRALHAISKLAELIEVLTALGLQPGEINLRANTLEDVFIQLTGRRLRE